MRRGFDWVKLGPAHLRVITVMEAGIKNVSSVDRFLIISILPDILKVVLDVKQLWPGA